MEQVSRAVPLGKTGPRIDAGNTASSRPSGRPSCCVMQFIVRYTGGAANRQEQRKKECLTTCLVQRGLPCRKGTARRTLAAASSSNLVGGEITSTCRPTQALRPGCAGLRVVQRYERKLSPQPSNIGSILKSALRASFASILRDTHG